MIVSTHSSPLPSARAEVHKDGDKIFIEYYDSAGSLMKTEPSDDIFSAQHLAEDWVSNLQTLLG